jgi:hypothetical protein
VTTLAGPYAAVALLLLAAAVAKLVEPTFTVGALRAAGIPARPSVVRGASVAEAAIACWALTTGARLPSLILAASYLALAGFVVMALGRGLPIGSCGCFGQPDTPPTTAHVIIDLGAALAAFLVAVQPVGAPLRPTGLHGLAWLAYLTYVGLAAATLGLVLTSRARLVGIAGRR